MSIFPETLKGQSVNVKFIFTSDGQGETLSLYDPTTCKQIIAPYGDTEQLILQTRKAKTEQ